MENKKHIKDSGIPLGMYRSVENARMFLPAHPVRDASLTGCRFCMVLSRSTERYIPDGMLCADIADVRLDNAICFTSPKLHSSSISAKLYVDGNSMHKVEPDGFNYVCLQKRLIQKYKNF